MFVGTNLSLVGFKMLYLKYRDTIFEKFKFPSHFVAHDVTLVDMNQFQPNQVQNRPTMHCL